MEKNVLKIPAVIINKNDNRISLISITTTQTCNNSYKFFSPCLCVDQFGYYS